MEISSSQQVMGVGLTVESVGVMRVRLVAILFSHLLVQRLHIHSNQAHFSLKVALTALLVVLPLLGDLGLLPSDLLVLKSLIVSPPQNNHRQHA